MKSVVILMVFVVCGMSALAQKDSVIIHDGWSKDTLRQKKQAGDTISKETEMVIWDNEARESKRGRGEINISLDEGVFQVGRYHKKRKSSFRGHWDGFYFGFVNFGNTDYSKYGGDEFMELDWANSFVMQFNVIKYSIGLNQRKNLGLVTGLGLEYQRLRFDRNITVRKGEDGMLQAVPLSELGIDHVKRSAFKTLYLTVPLLVEWQFPVTTRKKMYLATGPVGGVRLHSKTKIVYESESGNKRKEKDSNSYGMIPFKADWTLRVGYGGTCLWGSYTLTNMFDKDKAPGLHPYAIGIGFTI